MYRDPAIPCWVLATKCPLLLSQHLPLQPPLCLELWDHLAFTSSGNAVEDELSIILPVKQQRNSWKACGLAGCWSVLEMSSRIWAGFYYVSWRMHPVWLDQLLDQTAKAAPLNENQVAALQSDLLEKLVCLCVLHWISGSMIVKCWYKMSKMELLISHCLAWNQNLMFTVNVYRTGVFSISAKLRWIYLDMFLASYLLGKKWHRLKRSENSHFHQPFTAYSVSWWSFSLMLPSVM